MSRAGNSNENKKQTSQLPLSITFIEMEFQNCTNLELFFLSDSATYDFCYFPFSSSLNLHSYTLLGYYIYLAQILLAFIKAGENTMSHQRQWHK